MGVSSDHAGSGAVVRGAGPGPQFTYFGQVLSMKSSVCLVSLVPLIQSVMPVQKDFEPTWAGIRSEPSNRATVAGSCRICTESLSMEPVTALTSRLLLAEIQSPSFALLLAHSPEAR